MYIYESIYLSIHPSIHLSLHHSIFPNTHNMYHHIPAVCRQQQYPDGSSLYSKHSSTRYPCRCAGFHWNYHLASSLHWYSWLDNSGVKYKVMCNLPSKTVTHCQVCCMCVILCILYFIDKDILHSLVQGLMSVVKLICSTYKFLVGVYQHTVYHTSLEYT